MTSSQASSHDQALWVIQQAVAELAKWADAKLPDECQVREDSDAITRAKKLLSWTENAKIKPLRLLFDSVKLPDGEGQSEIHYWKPEAIADRKPTIPYASLREPTPTELEGLRLHIKNEIAQLNLNKSGWQNLSLLTLILEKFASHLSFEEEDVALIDLTRTTAAVAAALAKQPTTTHLSVVAGDLSGIQKFIYTISSDGALKSLRARSFYLELVTEEVVQQLLAALGLPRTNVIYAGGGNLYILADTENTRAIVDKVRECINEWLKRSFKGKVFLALDYLTFSTHEVGGKEFVNSWAKVPQKIAKQKLRKFDNKIDDLIKRTPSYEPCKVCHRDDLPSLKPLNRLENNSSPACWMCRIMFELGSELFGVEAIARSNHSTIRGAAQRLFIAGSYYYLFKNWQQAVAVQGAEAIFLINDWTINHYHANQSVPLLLGNYGQRSYINYYVNSKDITFSIILLTLTDKEFWLKRTLIIWKKIVFMSASEMAEAAKGIKRVGYLRMDVDKLGQVFAKGLKDYQTLPRLAGLSRLMSYFFKVYLNSLAENRSANLPQKTEYLTFDSKGKPLQRPNLLFIYAGGDDLFISGAWNEIVEFAFDTYQSFRTYTGWNPDITLSGGISINDIKYPLYQAANSSGFAEEAAKANNRNSLGLFGEVFKWGEWIKTKDTSIFIDKKTERYLLLEPEPELLGILSFVKQLTCQLDIRSDYSRNFIRSLLDTAETQEQMIKKLPEEENDIRYYLHLPKLAYALSRLPKALHEQRDFISVRQSLMNPRNSPYFRVIATWIELLTRSK